MQALARLNPSIGGSIGAATSTAVNDDIRVTNADGVIMQVSGRRYSNRVKLWTILLERIMKELDDEVKRFLSRDSGNFGKLVY